MDFVELSQNEIDELNSSAHTGVYREVIEQFSKAGIAGADVSDSFPGRKLQNASQALKRYAQQTEYKNIRVLYSRDGDNERLVLVNTSV